MRPTIFRVLAVTCGSGAGRGQLRQAFRDLEALPVQLAHPIERFAKTSLSDGLQEIIHGARFEGLDRMLVVGGHDHDDRELAALQFPDHIEAAHPRHLEVEEDNIGLETGDLAECFLAVLGFAYDLHIADLLKFLPKYLPGDRLVVHDQALDQGCDSSSSGISQYPAEDE